MTRGFTDTGQYTPVLAVEIDKAAAATYARNFRHEVLAVSPEDGQVNIKTDGLVFCGDIRQLNRIHIAGDIIIGGPPCQGFSPLGKMSPSDRRRKAQIDLNELWQQYLRIVHQVRPLAFVIENVPQLLRSRESVAIEVMARRLGYKVAKGTLKAVEFGVPQRRVRAFIVGLLGDVTPTLPPATDLRTTVRDAIGDLPLEPQGTELLPDDPGPVQRLHIGRNPTAKSLARYRLIEPGENRFALARKAPELTPRCWLEKPTGSTDVFGRLKWDEPAYTIRTEFFKPEKGCYLHPVADRPITHREAARLQTFDDDFWFEGTKIEIARQIGNAVPPRLAKALAEHLLPYLSEVKSRIENGWSAPSVDFGDTLQEVLELTYQRQREFDFSAL